MGRPRGQNGWVERGRDGWLGRYYRYRDGKRVGPLSRVVAPLFRVVSGRRFSVGKRDAEEELRRWLDLNVNAEREVVACSTMVDIWSMVERRIARMRIEDDGPVALIEDGSAA